MQTPAVVQVMIRLCNSLVGALYESVVAVARHFEKRKTPSETDVLRICLSDECLEWTADLCFGEIQAAPSAELQNFLIQCLVTPTQKSWDEWKAYEDKRCWETLKSRGVVVEDGHRIVTFSSVVAERYCSQWLYPERARSNPASLDELIEKVIWNLSASALRQSIAKDTGFTAKAALQQQFLQGLVLHTTSSYSISHDVSRLFSSSGTEGSLPIGFYLKGPHHWGLEVLVHEDPMEEHRSGFGAGGMYAPLDVKDYAVVYIRCNETGDVADAERLEKRVTVMFKRGDFSRCHCVFGMDEKVKKIAFLTP